MSDNIISSFLSVNMNRKLQWFTLKSLCVRHTKEKHRAKDVHLQQS